MSMQKLRPHAALIGGVCLLAGASAVAQVKTIPKEGLAGIPKEAIEFEIEHNYRRENNLGMTVPADPGTPPNSNDPRDLNGIWIQGKTYSVNADGSFSEGGSGPPRAGAAPGGAAGARPAGAPPGGGAGGPPGGGAGGPPGAAPGGAGGPGGGPQQAQCKPGSPFSMGLPSRIVQSDKAIYVFKNSQNDGTTYRRIEMNGTHPANVTPTYMGHSIGHWDGDTLVVETVGLKPAGGGGGPGGGGGNYTADSKVTEQIKKIEGGLKLEDVITIENPATQQVSKQRLVSYYRPDLRYVEAPCEDYSDPFEGKYPGQAGFTGKSTK